MNLLKNKTSTRRWLQALMLALLLNLSGHVFLHLGDAVFTGEEAHLTAHHESRTAAAPQHQCSICQDHQVLAFAVPATAAIVLAGRPPVVTTTAASVYDFQLLSLSHSRAPPRT